VFPTGSTALCALIGQSEKHWRDHPLPRPTANRSNQTLTAERRQSTSALSLHPTDHTQHTPHADSDSPRPTHRPALTRRRPHEPRRPASPPLRFPLDRSVPLPRLAFAHTPPLVAFVFPARLECFDELLCSGLGDGFRWGRFGGWERGEVAGSCEGSTGWCGIYRGRSSSRRSLARITFAFHRTWRRTREATVDTGVVDVHSTVGVLGDELV